MAAPNYYCTECSSLRKKYRSQCPICSAYSTFITVDQARARGLALPIGSGTGVRLHYMRTSIVGLDEVASTGPGLVRGVCYLVTGGPGAGKSTMLIQVAVHLSRSKRVVYAFLEPGEDFVGALSLRLGLDMSRVRGVDADSVDQLIERVGNVDVVILDSLQGLSQRSGEPIDTIAHKLAEHGHATGTTWLLIGHINKEGDVSGVMATEHWVDTTLHLSREHGQGLRVLSAGKNRYGPEQVRFLRMDKKAGLVDMPDASSYLLADRVPGEVGSCVAAVLVQGWQGTAPQAGVAPVLVEVQALASRIGRNEETGKLYHPSKIVASGVPSDRVRLILEVLGQKTSIDTSEYDITINVCGDMDVKDRSLEAPVALAVASAIRDQALPPDLCAWGEIDLTGRIRGLTSTDDRAEMAGKSGFGKVLHVGRVSDAIDSLLIDPASRAGDTSPRGKPRQAVPGRAHGGKRARSVKPAAADARKPDARRKNAVRVPAKPRAVRSQGAGRRV